MFKKMFQQKRYDDALKFAKEAHRAAVETGDQSFEAQSSYAQGILYQKLGDIENALNFYNEAIKVALQNNFFDKLVYSYSEVAKMYLANFQYDLAAENYIEALKYAELVNNTNYIGTIYNELGLIDLRLGNYEEALISLNQAVAYKLNNNIIENINITKLNIGLCYHNISKYSNALEVYFDILKTYKQGNCKECDNLLIAKLYLEMGSTYLSLNEYEESKKHIYSALNLFKNDSIEDDRILARSYGYLSDLYMKQQISDSASYYLGKSLDYALENNDVKNIITNKLQFAKIYEKEGRYAEALKLTNEATQLKDSIYSSDLGKRIRDAYVNLEKYKSDKVITRQGETIKRSYNILFMSGVILILLTIILALTYRALTYRREINKKLDIMVKQKTQELLNTNEELVHSRKELDSFLYRTSHDIRGPIATLMGLTKLARLEANDTVMQNYLEKIEITSNKLNAVINRLTNVSQINSQPLDIRDINIYQVVNEVIRDIKPDKSVSFKLTGDTNESIKTDKILLKIILENLLENSFKFFDDKENDPFVELNFKQNGNLEFTITDNGVGIDPQFRERVFELFFVANEKERGTGIGLYQTQLAIKKLDGNVELALNKKPTSFRVMIPTNGNKNLTAEQVTQEPA
jgi:signal transduction histidine kinase